MIFFLHLDKFSPALELSCALLSNGRVSDSGKYVRLSVFNVDSDTLKFHLPFYSLPPLIQVPSQQQLL